MHSRTWCVLATVSLVTLGSSNPLAAQAQRLRPADRGGLEPATLLLLSRGDLAPLPIQLPPGETGPDRLRGALWGAGIGFAAGGLLGGLTVGSDGGDEGFGSSLVAASATGEAVVLGALVGAVIGALLGATVLAPHRSPAEASRGEVDISAARITAPGVIDIAVRLRR